MDLYSSTPPYSTVEAIANENAEKFIDLRPYMVYHPFTVWDKDDLQKVLDVFRKNNLRHLPVVSHKDNTLLGIITR